MIILGRQKDFCYRYGWVGRWVGVCVCVCVCVGGGGLGRVNVIRLCVGPTVGGMLSDCPLPPIFVSLGSHTGFSNYTVPALLWLLPDC